MKFPKLSIISVIVLMISLALVHESNTLETLYKVMVISSAILASIAFTSSLVFEMFTLCKLNMSQSDDALFTLYKVFLVSIVISLFLLILIFFLVGIDWLNSLLGVVF